MDTGKIDLLLQYALLVAGDEDEPLERQLGPIHLIKYVYLGDLAFAEAHSGETFTGTPWRFYKFGPWSQAVHDRIEPALNAIHANRKVFPSKFREDGEWERWNLTDDARLAEIARELPVCITGRLRRSVHKFLADTPDLLAFVYNTPPMRNAAPNERLDFATAAAPHSEEPPAVAGNGQPLTAKQKKKLKEGMARLRAKLEEKKAADKKRQASHPPQPAPLYDDVYFAGLEWLDSLAGEKIPAGEIRAVFADDIWKSPARIDDDFPG